MHPFIQADREEAKAAKVKSNIPQVDLSSMTTAIQQQQLQQQQTDTPGSTLSSAFGAVPAGGVGFGLLGNRNSSIT